MIPFSVLDLAPIPEGGTAAEALGNTLDLARRAEAWGYRRFWLAEHHNMPGIASAATAVVIGAVAAATRTIRVGAGGIMLPNHAPLTVAEDFGTLATLHPGRIDLGLGRAPGTDQPTMRALRRYMEGADRFPQDLGYRLELGIRLAEADQLDEAIVELQQARKEPRLLWKAAMHLGLCFKKRNNWRLAQRNFEEALAQLPPNEEEGRKEILYHLAVGSAESGELQRAIDLGHDLANIDFGFKDIGKLLDDWENRLQEA